MVPERTAAIQRRRERELVGDLRSEESPTHQLMRRCVGIERKRMRRNEKGCVGNLELKSWKPLYFIFKRKEEERRKWVCFRCMRVLISSCCGCGRTDVDV